MNNYFPNQNGEIQTVMYNRAIKRLKSLLNNKGLQETAISNSKFDLFHFHIDAPDNQISMNKFETNPSMNNSYFSNASHKKSAANF